jgi:hypothetical protein
MVRSLVLVVPVLLTLALPALSQSGSYLLGPGSNVGPATKVKTENCVTKADGSVTCDTRLVNPAGDTDARPQYDYFGY